MEELKLIYNKLNKLKLSGIAESLEEKIKKAGTERWSYSVFLDFLLTEELDRRGSKQLTKRLAKSHLNLDKTLETFEFDFNEKIQTGLIKELGGCDFIRQKQNVFILGPSGVGKSHIAQSLGHEACRKNFEVLFFDMQDLFEWLHCGKGDGTYRKRLEAVIKTQLLVIDDFALEPLSESQQSEFYQIIAKKYEKSSLIITSNRDFSEWGGCFSNTLLAMATLDRLVHKGIKIVIEGKSYRLEEFKKRTCVKQKMKKID